MANINNSNVTSKQKRLNKKEQKRMKAINLLRTKRQNLQTKHEEKLMKS